MSQPSASPHRGRFFRIAAAFTVLLALAGYLAVQYITSRPGAPRCIVRPPEGDGEEYRLSQEQAANAATISAVGTTRGMPERAVTIALATALQESALRNISHGDRDSLGLFQQRPSQGWGTPEQIMDPVYSAGKFYEHLAKVPGYSRLPLTEAAQRVQRSGYPQAYAKHEPDAALLAGALTGRAPASLTCVARPGGGPGDPAKVRAGLMGAFGRDVLPAAPSGGAEAGLAGGTASAPSRDMTVPVPARAAAQRGSGSQEQHGWELAHWAVAHADALRIDEVAYAGKVWSAADSVEGWRAAPKSAARSKDEVRITVAD
ncbi:hypothetical protein [Streptomyces sannanensis]|uniref:hypothetical protein n=1 Tax=Streptomyces sannanensis TaxID=285536 RepID=UPI0031EDBBFD